MRREKPLQITHFSPRTINSIHCAPRSNAERAAKPKQYFKLGLFKTHCTLAVSEPRLDNNLKICLPRQHLGTFDGPKLSFYTVCFSVSKKSQEQFWVFKKIPKLHVNPSTVDYARNGLFIPLPPSTQASKLHSMTTRYRRFSKVACLKLDTMTRKIWTGKVTVWVQTNLSVTHEYFTHLSAFSKHSQLFPRTACEKKILQYGFEGAEYDSTVCNTSGLM